MADKVMSAASVWTPRVELGELPGGYVLKVELPGTRLEDIRVTVRQPLLMIVGGRSGALPTREGLLALDVFGWTWALPPGVERAAISAHFVDSTLILRIPKACRGWQLEGWAATENAGVLAN
jgi:HSP20 family molecular chaperone IbpA